MGGYVDVWICGRVGRRRHVVAAHVVSVSSPGLMTLLGSGSV